MACWEIKEQNMELDKVGRKRSLQISVLEDIKDEDYENGKIYKECTNIQRAY